MVILYLCLFLFIDVTYVISLTVAFAAFIPGLLVSHQSFLICDIS